MRALWCVGLRTQTLSEALGPWPHDLNCWPDFSPSAVYFLDDFLKGGGKQQWSLSMCVCSTNFSMTKTFQVFTLAGWQAPPAHTAPGQPFPFLLTCLCVLWWGTDPPGEAFLSISTGSGKLAPRKWQIWRGDLEDRCWLSVFILLEQEGGGEENQRMRREVFVLVQTMLQRCATEKSGVLPILATSLLHNCEWSKAVGLGTLGSFHQEKVFCDFRAPPCHLFGLFWHLLMMLVKSCLKRAGDCKWSTLNLVHVWVKLLLRATAT